GRSSRAATPRFAPRFSSDSGAARRWRRPPARRPPRPAPDPVQGAPRMWSDAYAQAAGGPPPMNSPLAVFAQFGWVILVFVVMYLLLIRPQQQQQKKAQQMLKALKKGDRVVTTG